MNNENMTIEEKLEDYGYNDVALFKNFSYDTAFVGVDENNRAVYDYDKMIDYLVDTENMTYGDAIEWVEYNTIRALPYFGEGCPIILHKI